MIFAFVVIALMFSSRSLSGEPSGQWGSYPNRPLVLQDLVPPDGRRFSLVNDFNYVDQSERLWEAPSGLVVDGASIPMPFWSLIGGPFEGLYREASVIHDAACCAKMQPWKDVHHMFYSAMRCSGVSWAKGKIMFLAVWAFGPHWKQLNSSMPASCMTEESPGRFHGAGSWPPPPVVDDNLWREIRQGTLSLLEARAVARPFFTQGPITDDDAIALVAKLQRRTDLTHEERQIVFLSVVQSELISDEEVAQLEQWIEQANPPLEVIEAQAEQLRNRRLTELRLFPRVRGLLQAANDYRIGTPSVTSRRLIVILYVSMVSIVLVVVVIRSALHKLRT